MKKTEVLLKHILQNLYSRKPYLFARRDIILLLGALNRKSKLGELVKRTTQPV